MKNCGSTGLKPRVCWPCEHSTIELPSHPVISPTTFHLNPTRLHTSLGTLNLSTNFLWGNPRISYILPWRTYRLDHLSTVCFSCWEPFEKVDFFLARPGLKPRVFRWPWEHSTTELPRHPVIWPTTFHLHPTLVTYAI